MTFTTALYTHDIRLRTTVSMGWWGNPVLAGWFDDPVPEKLKVIDEVVNQITNAVLRGSQYDAFSLAYATSTNWEEVAHLYNIKRNSNARRETVMGHASRARIKIIRTAVNPEVLKETDRSLYDWLKPKYIKLV